MKIAIVGSRNFSCPNFVKEKVNNLCENLGRMEKPLTIISGGAKGVDSWAEEIAKNWEGLGVEVKVFSADWDKYGKRAGAIRNQQIVDESTNVLAFWDGKSKGTKITIDMAVKSGKPVNIYVRK